MLVVVREVEGGVDWALGYSHMVHDVVTTIHIIN